MERREETEIDRKVSCAALTGLLVKLRAEPTVNKLHQLTLRRKWNRSLLQLFDRLGSNRIVIGLK